MSWTRPDRESTDVSLAALFFLCLFTVFMCQTRLTATRKGQPEKLQEKWTVWKQEGKARGPFLKAAILASTPVLSLASTLLLLVGLVRRNVYLFFPWLVLTLRGIVAVQASNLLEVFGSVAERNDLFFCLVLVAFDAAECFCFREVFRLFRTVWVMGERSEEADAEEKRPEERQFSGFEQ